MSRSPFKDSYQVSKRFGISEINPEMEYIKVKVRVKLSLCLTKYHTMKTYGGVGV
jgi:hypothetical protein